MKKVIYISLLAITMIGCLQGYNVYLQYLNYIREQLTKINAELYKSIDEEYNLRSRRTYKPDRVGQQHAYCKLYPAGKAPKPKEGESVIRLDSFDIKDLKAKGFISSEYELIALLSQDQVAAKGYPINLKILDTVFEKNLKDKYDHSILLLNKDKKVIKTYGRKDIPLTWAFSKDYAVNLANPRFVRVAIHIPPSQFIWHSIGTLVLSLLFVLIATICIGYQLREIKRKDELLKNRELSVNSIIHDLKAPINSVITLMSIIKMKVTDANVLNLVEQTSDKAKRLVNSIETILSVAGDKRRIILNLCPTPVMELIYTAKSDVDILYKDKSHSITVNDQTNGTALAQADKQYLLNVLRNLMENAVKYADEGVKVLVDVENVDNMLRVSIVDNGWGISKKDQRNIFKQFYRVPHEHGPKGHGIGLALVKYVVEAHGGRITVESEPGKGSKFCFTIPVGK